MHKGQTLHDYMNQYAISKGTNQAVEVVLQQMRSSYITAHEISHDVQASKNFVGLPNQTGLPSFQPNLPTKNSGVRQKNWHQVWNKVEMTSDVSMTGG